MQKNHEKTKNKILWNRIHDKKNNDKKLPSEMCKWSSNNRANNKSKISHDIWHDIIWCNI